MGEHEIISNIIETLEETGCNDVIRKKNKKFIKNDDELKIIYH